MMKVYVIGLNGKPLMPTTPRKARVLLRDGKAEVHCKVPFTIRLLYKTGTATQPVMLGIDTGESHIGIAVESGGHILEKAEVTLRSTMDKRKLMETRKEYRCGRRYRKVRYRKPKFRQSTKRVYSYNPKKKLFRWMKKANTYDSNRRKGWLPPSIESKVLHHMQWIRRYTEVLPDPKVRIEVARFDIRRMMDPSIHNELYQQGRLYDYENEKAYVLAKFGYTCPVCGHKFDNDHKARIHHPKMRSLGSTDNPDDLVPVCERCHEKPEIHDPGSALWKKLVRLTRSKEYREPTFMNILRKRLYKSFPKAGFTYGNITNADRKALELKKSHANDAVAIAAHGQDKVVDADGCTYIRQVRRKKRSLHEANPRKGRKEPNRRAKRNAKNTKCSCGVYLWDEVKAFGRTGYVSGFTGSGSVYVVDSDGKYITKSSRYKQVNISDVRVRHHNNSWLLWSA